MSMDSIINEEQAIVHRIYELENRPLLVPENLIDTLKVVGYEELHVTKNKKGVVCQLLFKEEGKQTVFTYQFNKKDWLLSLKARVQQGERKETLVLFNRERELVSLVKRFQRGTINDKEKV